MIKIKRNITSTRYLCGMGVTCPAAYELADGELLVVGKSIKPSELPDDVRNRIADSETAVVIPPGLISLQR